ncbi:hypothetical protein CBOM_06953 [Ceraceosorus bombacis]|uniref:Uncharacterized protein n=1 Tax=Ceraceosorus bombacis TaxID=401625 RepID=A0A0P1BLV6_9BASI|nr:hypothetical protein CBOM_06953 [Ceraceosorus bombacis]
MHPDHPVRQRNREYWQLYAQRARKTTVLNETFPPQHLVKANESFDAASKAPNSPMRDVRLSFKDGASNRINRKAIELAVAHYKKYYLPTMAQLNLGIGFRRTPEEPIVHAKGVAWDSRGAKLHGGGVTSEGHTFEGHHIFMAPNTAAVINHRLDGVVGTTRPDGFPTTSDKERPPDRAMVFVPPADAHLGTRTGRPRMMLRDSAVQAVRHVPGRVILPADWAGSSKLSPVKSKKRVQIVLDRPVSHAHGAAIDQALNAHRDKYHPQIDRFRVRKTIHADAKEPRPHITAAAYDAKGNSVPGGGITSTGVHHREHKVYLEEGTLVHLSRGRHGKIGRTVHAENPGPKAKVSSTRHDLGGRYPIVDKFGLWRGQTGRPLQTRRKSRSKHSIYEGGETSTGTTIPPEAARPENATRQLRLPQPTAEKHSVDQGGSLAPSGKRRRISLGAVPTLSPPATTSAPAETSRAWINEALPSPGKSIRADVEAASDHWALHAPPSQLSPAHEARTRHTPPSSGSSALPGEHIHRRPTNVEPTDAFWHAHLSDFNTPKRLRLSSHAIAAIAAGVSSKNPSSQQTPGKDLLQNAPTVSSTHAGSTTTELAKVTAAWETASGLTPHVGGHQHLRTTFSNTGAYGLPSTGLEHNVAPVQTAAHTSAPDNAGTGEYAHLRAQSLSLNHDVDTRHAVYYSAQKDSAPSEPGDHLGIATERDPSVLDYVHPQSPSLYQDWQSLHQSQHLPEHHAVLTPSSAHVGAPPIFHTGAPYHVDTHSPPREHDWDDLRHLFRTPAHSPLHSPERLFESGLKISPRARFFHW